MAIAIVSAGAIVPAAIISVDVTGIVIGISIAVATEVVVAAAAIVIGTANCIVIAIVNVIDIIRVATMLDIATATAVAIRTEITFVNSNAVARSVSITTASCIGLAIRHSYGCCSHH